MKYILDSNVVSDLFDPTTKAYPQLNKNLSQLKEEDEVFISVLTIFELEFGYKNTPESAKPKVKAKIDSIKKALTSISLKENSAQYYADFKYYIRQNPKNFFDPNIDAKKLKEEMQKFNIDLLIGSTACVEKAILVSADKLYQKLSPHFHDLQVANWEK